jgi:hypothetical protein
MEKGEFQLAREVLTHIIAEVKRKKHYNPSEDDNSQICFVVRYVKWYRDDHFPSYGG